MKRYRVNITLLVKDLVYVEAEDAFRAERVAKHHRWYMGDRELRQSGNVLTSTYELEPLEAKAHELGDTEWPEMEPVNPIPEAEP